MSLMLKDPSKFGLDLYNRLTKPGENAVFSSYSVSSVLSMASMGAKGSTSPGNEGSSSSPRGLTAHSKRPTPPSQHFWTPKKTAVHENYVQDVLKYFSSDVQSIDYITLKLPQSLKMMGPPMFAEWTLKLATPKTSNVTSFALPYKGNRLSMIIFLPKERLVLRSGKYIIDTSKVEVYLPKDLPSWHLRCFWIAGEPKELFVSEVVQKAMIEVNEEGTEAAAATMMQITPCCLVFRDKLFCGSPLCLYDSRQSN
ncbi:Leukocyte elastase inhibitor C [Caligus rogercresseyi]|uniref:Leukocyte elastase inhibitor C n=1 Tax=Caligus rogercresseyi TaxID=217165 RepID=A0A7T8KIR4_CALRO|nr:Leukocyte elastase inhibitor C [Caligus rogercresseyi]